MAVHKGSVENIAYQQFIAQNPHLSKFDCNIASKVVFIIEFYNVLILFLQLEATINLASIINNLVSRHADYLEVRTAHMEISFKGYFFYVKNSRIKLGVI